MPENSAAPAKLPSNQFDHFYLGGNRIGALRHGPGGPMRPEEWIGSVTTRFGEDRMGLSTLSRGELLRDAIHREPVAWLGSNHLANFGESTEILVKLLDPDQRLPVHYHPNRAFSKEHLGLAHGKTEAWIILEAPEGATVGLGFNRECSKAEITELVARKDSDALLGLLRQFEVKPGDSIVVPAGVPHAIGAGIFILELQEPTDLSILLEWNDFAVDGVKDGHLNLGFDVALDALNYSPLSDDEVSQLVRTNQAFEASDFAIFAATANPYFRADYLAEDGSEISAGFSILLVLEGKGFIEFDEVPSVIVERGDAFAIPHAAGDWRLRGARGIVSRPPLIADSRTAV